MSETKRFSTLVRLMVTAAIIVGAVFANQLWLGTAYGGVLAAALGTAWWFWSGLDGRQIGKIDG